MDDIRSSTSAAAGSSAGSSARSGGGRSISPGRSGRDLSLRFSARDLVDTAIFAVIFLVLTFVFGFLGVLGPAVWLVSVPLSIIVNGITFTLFLTRVTHPGMIMLLAVVLAIFFLLHGGALSGAVLSLVVGLVAEVIAHLGGYRTRRTAIATYTVFGLAAFSPFLPVLLNRQAYFASSAWQSMGDAYVSASERLFTVPVLSGVALLCLVAGFLGALLGTTMLRKHFVRAGLA